MRGLCLLFSSSPWLTLRRINLQFYSHKIIECKSPNVYSFSMSPKVIWLFFFFFFWISASRLAMGKVCWYKLYWWMMSIRVIMAKNFANNLHRLSLTFAYKMKSSSLIYFLYVHMATRWRHFHWAVASRYWWKPSKTNLAGLIPFLHFTVQYWKKQCVIFHTHYPAEELFNCPNDIFMVVITTLWNYFSSTAN